MVMSSALEAAPPGLVASSFPVPAPVKSLAGMATVRCVASIPDPQLAAQQFAGLLVGDLMHRAMLGQEIPSSPKQMEARAEASVNAFLAIYGE
jgi:hypothetical protein